MIVRRRLRYEAWYAVHLTAYAAIALGWFHQIPTGNELSSTRSPQDYWHALYVATLALLVGFRLVAARVVDALRHRLRVAEVCREGPGVVSLRITGRGLDRLDARAGQFFLWRFLTPRPLVGGASLLALRGARRPLAPDHGQGRSATSRAASASSSPARASSPRARSASSPTAARRRDKVLLIAGGIGITPIRALLEEMRRRPRRRLPRAPRGRRRAPRRARAHRAARARSPSTSSPATTRRARAERLLSPEHLRELVPDLAEREVYLCGPPAMADAIEKNVRRAGVPRRHLHIERFAL